MRLTILALALFPFAAHAQSATEQTPTEPAQNGQGCAIGMIWSNETQSCVASDEGSSPLQGLQERSNCHTPPAVSA